MCVCVCVFGKGRPRRCATAFTQQLASSLAWLHIYTDLFPSSSKSSSPALFRRQHFVRAQSELISPFLGVTEPAPASADSSHCELHIYFHKSLSTLTNSISVHNFSNSTKNVHILISVFDCNWSIFPQTKFWQWSSNSHSKILFQARQGWPDPPVSQVESTWFKVGSDEGSHSMSPSHSQAQSSKFQFYKILYLATGTDGNQSAGVAKSLIAVSPSRPYHLHLLALILTLTTCGILCSGQSQRWMEPAHDSRLTGFISLLLRTSENENWNIVVFSHNIALTKSWNICSGITIKNSNVKKGGECFKDFWCSPWKIHASRKRILEEGEAKRAKSFGDVCKFWGGGSFSWSRMRGWKLCKWCTLGNGWE